MSPSKVPTEFRLDKTVVLVGLMGAGKSTVGKRLANHINVDFYDSDLEIEKAADLTIPEIFERFGEKYFRDGEQRVVSRLLNSDPCIVATGGGAFISDEIREMINEKGFAVWINADLETLWGRVEGKPGRPLLERPDAKKVLENLLNTRYPIYALSDHVVTSKKGRPHERVVNDIVKGLKKNNVLKQINRGE